MKWMLFLSLPALLLPALLLVPLESLHADITGAEMLQTAEIQGDLKTMESLLSAGLDPNVRLRLGETPLSLAVQLGNNVQLVQLLLKWHADPNAPIRFSQTPLQLEAQTGNVRMASILIAAGAQVNTKGAKGRTALHSAGAGGHLDMIRLLAEKGADLNARDEEGASPLDDAVWQGALDTVAILLAHGARLNEPDTQTGATPINEAANRSSIQVVQFLLQFHPDLSIPDKRDFTPLDNAIRMGIEDSALLLLDAQPKELQTPPLFGKTMDAAIRKDESLVVDDLLRLGVPVNAALPSGNTPLDAAAFAGAVKTAGILLNHSADPNLSGPDGTTPLEDAALKRFTSVAGLLLDHGALVDHLNRASGTTALYAAASFGKIDLVKVLLDRGANPSLCGANRKSPYQAAVENGYNDVANEIKAHGGADSCRQ